MTLFPHALKHDDSEATGNPPARRVVRHALVVVVVLAVVVPALPASATTGSISGAVFEDANRNGVRDAGEPVWAGELLILLDAAGSYLANARTGSDGRFAFDGLAAGRYRVEYAADHWWPIRDTWAPTTTPTLRPEQDIEVSGNASALFGWRRLTKSTDVFAPIDEYVGSTGLRVQVYNDAVPARDIHDALLRGTVGEEASMITVRFGLGGSSTTSASMGSQDGRYASYRAVSYVSYESWLDGGDVILSHEYGHAWGGYYQYLVQQDPSLSGYLKARGLAGDPRLDSSYAWTRDELLAEDYRQLLGSPTARQGAQVNREIPPAAVVSGLESYLRDTFTATAPAETEPAPEPAPSPTATASPDPSPTVSPSPTPSPTVSPSPAPSTGKTKGGGSGGGSTCKNKRC